MVLKVVIFLHYFDPALKAQTYPMREYETGKLFVIINQVMIKLQKQ